LSRCGGSFGFSSCTFRRWRPHMTSKLTADGHKARAGFNGPGDYWQGTKALRIAPLDLRRNTLGYSALQIILGARAHR
jgi:hypothetical protein